MRLKKKGEGEGKWRKKGRRDDETKQIGTGQGRKKGRKGKVEEREKGMGKRGRRRGKGKKRGKGEGDIVGYGILVTFVTQGANTAVSPQFPLFFSILPLSSFPSPPYPSLRFPLFLPVPPFNPYSLFFPFIPLSFTTYNFPSSSAIPLSLPLFFPSFISFPPLLSSFPSSLPLSFFFPLTSLSLL